MDKSGVLWDKSRGHKESLEEHSSMGWFTDFEYNCSIAIPRIQILPNIQKRNGRKEKEEKEAIKIFKNKKISSSIKKHFGNKKRTSSI